MCSNVQPVANGYVKNTVSFVRNVKIIFVLSILKIIVRYAIPLYAVIAFHNAKFVGDLFAMNMPENAISVERMFVFTVVPQPDHCLKKPIYAGFAVQNNLIYNDIKQDII